MASSSPGSHGERRLGRDRPPSLVFAGSHFQLLPFPGLLAFGIVAGIVAHRTGRLGPAIALHVGFNLTTVVAQLSS